jgi:hypothetical protein
VPPSYAFFLFNGTKPDPSMLSNQPVAPQHACCECIRNQNNSHQQKHTDPLPTQYSQNASYPPRSDHQIAPRLRP